MTADLCRCGKPAVFEIDDGDRFQMSFCRSCAKDLTKQSRRFRPRFRGLAAKLASTKAPNRNDCWQAIRRKLLDTPAVSRAHADLQAVLAQEGPPPWT